MIPLTELRIGNYVKLNGRIMKPNAELMALVITGETVEPMPIPLTPEILEKCGFEYDKNGWYKISYTAFEVNEVDKDVFEHILEHLVEISVNVQSNWANIHNITDDEQGATPKKQVNYLHQLQNLYFALTNSELIIDL